VELRPGRPEEVGFLPERIDRARDLCGSWVKSGETPSLIVLVARRGRIVLHEAFGQLRPEPDSPPLRTDSIFPVASITKPMTATLAMQLVEEGLLGLNRPVRDYLPELSGEGTEEVLVHHLLTHTSGFNDEEVIAFTDTKLKAGPEIPPHDPTQHPLVHFLLTLRWSAPLWKAPGIEMSYTDHNYLLLGEIVRRVSGRRIEDLARERLFDPLGMNDTGYSVPESVSPRIVKRPADAPGGTNDAASLDTRQTEETPWPFGGVFSTARDLAVFGQALLNGGEYGGVRILGRSSVSEMTRNQIPGIGAQLGNHFYGEASYGYGWIVKSNEKWKSFDSVLVPIGSFSHSGHGGTMLWIDAVHEIVGVYLSVSLGLIDDQLPIWNLDLFQSVITSAAVD
jgi:CubicO group peptidase (beta-lactamase class C family)